MENKIEYSVIIENLKKLRVAHSYSQDDIAGILGLSRSAYTYMEIGKSKIGVIALITLMDLYGVSFEDLCKPMVPETSRMRPARQAQHRVIPSPESTMQLTPEERTLIVNYRISKSVPELVARLRDSNMPMDFTHK